MYNEFAENATFTGNDAFSNGDQILTFYEIENVDPGKNLVTLLGYFLVVNLLACIVLVLRYNLFSGKIEAPIQDLSNGTADAPPASVDLAKERPLKEEDLANGTAGAPPASVDLAKEQPLKEEEDGEEAD